MDQPYSSGYCSITISTEVGGRMFYLRHLLAAQEKKLCL